MPSSFIWMWFLIPPFWRQVIVIGWMGHRSWQFSARIQAHDIALQSMDWFKGECSGKPHDLNWNIDGFRLRFSVKKHIHNGSNDIRKSETHGSNWIPGWVLPCRICTFLLSCKLLKVMPIYLVRYTPHRPYILDGAPKIAFSYLKKAAELYNYGLSWI